MFEIYVKKKNNRCWELAIEVPNAWGGMPHLWMFLEKKYLPSYVPVGEDGKPLNLEWVKEANSKGEYVSRWAASDFFGEKYDAPISKFWDCVFFKDVYNKIRKQKMSKLNEKF